MPFLWGGGGGGGGGSTDKTWNVPMSSGVLVDGIRKLFYSNFENRP